MSTLVNVPNIHDDKLGIGCSYDSDSNSFDVHSINPDGSKKWSMGNVCASTPESISNDIAGLLISMRGIGFDQGRKHIRDAMGSD